jgi:uncharacterized membrane protein
MATGWWRHLVSSPWALRRAFPAATLAAINAAVADGERRHAAEVRVAIEPAFSLAQLWHGTTPRQRAVDVFSRMRMWDTAGNNGVLIYILLAEHDIEIVADRAFAGCVPATAWEEICRAMVAAFHAGDYQGGTVQAVERVHALAAPLFPVSGGSPNELPDATVLL